LTDTEPDSDKTRMSLGEHLEELRRRIMYALVGVAVAAVAGLISGRYLVELFKLPYIRATAESGIKADLAVLTVTAGFMSYLKVSLIAALLLASPWIFYQMWMFISAGLHKRERRYVMFAAPASATLFICGALFFVFVAAVPILKFFVFFSDWMGLKLVVTLESHISMMVRMMLVFGLGFQTPLVVLVLVKMGVVSLATLHHYRRHVIVGIVILAAIMTPPDVISQLALAVPMWGLFELGVLLGYVFTRKGSPSED